jgi:hypothetical protein
MRRIWPIEIAISSGEPVFRGGFEETATIPIATNDQPPADLGSRCLPPITDLGDQCMNSWRKSLPPDGASEMDPIGEATGVAG